MRIRRETDSFNWRTWLKVFFSLLVIFNIINVAFLVSDSLLTFNVFSGLLFPFVLASTSAQNLRTSRLYVSDLADQNTLKVLMKRKLESERYQMVVYEDTWICLPINRIYKISHRFFGGEQMTIRWAHEIVIEGNQRIVGIIDDFLTWNKDVKELSTSLSHVVS